MIKLKKLLEKLTKSGIEIRLISSPEELEKFRFFVEEVHYMHKLAKGINSKFGAFYNNEMIGVIGYGPSSMPQIFKDIAGNFDKTEIQELRRLVIARKTDINTLHQRMAVIPEWYNKAVEIASNMSNLASQIISAANYEMKVKIPSLKIIITFADSREGHHGGVYQSTITPGITGDYYGQATDKRYHLYIYYLGSTKERQETIKRLTNMSAKRQPMGKFPKPDIVGAN